MELAQKKRRLRSEMKEIVGFVAGKSERSELLLKSILDLKLLEDASLIAIFIPMEDEVDTIPLIEYCWKNKIVVTVPEIIQNHHERFVLRQWKKSDHLYETKHGIFHPKNSKVYDLSEADAIFVPGLAFTKEGVRLGRGMGFYDRLLSQYKGRKIGLCFKEQVKESLPSDQRDITVDKVVTC